MEYQAGIDGSVSSTGLAIKHTMCGAEIVIGWTKGKRLAASRKNTNNAPACYCTFLKKIFARDLSFPPLLIEHVLIGYCKETRLLTRLLPYPELDIKAMSYEARLDFLTQMIVNELARFIPSKASKRAEFTFEAVPLHMEGSSSVSILRDYSAVLRNKIYNAFIGCIIRELSPSTIKKQWTGKGNCKKPDMYRVFRSQYETQPLSKADVQFYGFTTSIESVKAEAKPLQDMVDARAILGGVVEKRDQNKKAKKKRTFMMVFSN